VDDIYVWIFFYDASPELVDKFCYLGEMLSVVEDDTRVRTIHKNGLD